MNIGFCTLYSWRPHVEHSFFLSKLVKKCGHNVRFLTCDSDLNYCYTRALRENRSETSHCLRCRIGGIRSYTSEGVNSIGSLSYLGEEGRDFSEWAYSSASTLGRYESNEDYMSLEFLHTQKKLTPEVKKVYFATLEWIKKENLKSICLFNGRMDITRAVAEAAKFSGINYVSIERSWFGDGIQILPGEDCLGLKNIYAISSKYKNLCLTMSQAETSASYLASRFLRKNAKEWRAYNLDAKISNWPVDSLQNKRVLILPSSRNEVIKHSDWTPGWSEPSIGFESIIKGLNLQPGEVVLRGHPNWAEKIGLSGGEKIEKYYQEWSKRMGIHYIKSADKESTQNLIEQSDCIITNGGTAAIEAAILGKPVISIAPSVYAEAGFTMEIHSEAKIDIAAIKSYLRDMCETSYKRLIIKRALRFTYCMANRIPQYFDYIKSINTTSYKYLEGADPEKLMRLLNGGELIEDDETYDIDSCFEDRIVDNIISRNWNKLLKEQKVHSPNFYKIERKLFYQPIDLIRNLFKRGDL